MMVDNPIQLVDEKTLHNKNIDFAGAQKICDAIFKTENIGLNTSDWTNVELETEFKKSLFHHAYKNEKQAFKRVVLGALITHSISFPLDLFYY